MPFFQHITTAWFNRQYRITFRAVLTGLLANDWYGEQGDDVVVKKAHEITVASLKQFQKAEV